MLEELEWDRALDEQQREIDNMLAETEHEKSLHQQKELEGNVRHLKKCHDLLFKALKGLSKVKEEDGGARGRIERQLRVFRDAVKKKKGKVRRLRERGR